MEQKNADISGIEQLPSSRSGFEKLKIFFQVLRKTYQTLNKLVELGQTQTPEQRTKSYQVQREWGTELLNYIGFKRIVTGTPSEDPCLYVANHMGYIDIAVLKGLINASFVSKKEVKNWIIFGPAATAAETVYVDRSNPISRKNIADQIGKFIVEQKKSVAIFPEGTSSTHGKAWKRGSFVVASRYKIKVQPICIAFRPHRPCAYIGKDSFVSHLWRLMDFRNLEVHVHFFEPRFINRVDDDVPKIQELVQSSLFEKLKLWGERLEPYES